MKPGGSALNPNAEAYVPLSKRDDASAKPVAAAHPFVAAHGSRMYMPKTTTSFEKQMIDDDDSVELDTDIEFLLATFSDLSFESINDVYLANNGDVDATIEMLTQLEIFSTEAEEYLPDTLDTRDVPETIEPLTSSAPTQKNTTSSPELMMSL